MRSAPEVQHCLGLHESGLNASQIARATGIPRATVRDWIDGYVPRACPDLRPRCPECGHPEHRRDALPREYAYLLGAYLGDGCISAHPRGVFRLRITLDTAYPGIIEEVSEAVRVVMSASSVAQVPRRSNCLDVSAYSKSWPCLFPQHGPGPKHKRRIALQAWQWIVVEDNPELFLRGLIHSDGCRFINTGRRWRHPRYVFSNRSADIRHIFTEACGLIGLRWTTSRHLVYVSRKADVARMDEFIGPKT